MCLTHESIYAALSDLSNVYFLFFLVVFLFSDPHNVLFLSVVALVINVNSYMLHNSSQNPINFLGLGHKMPHLSSYRSSILSVLVFKKVVQLMELRILKDLRLLFFFFPGISLIHYWDVFAIAHNVLLPLYDHKHVKVKLNHVLN